MSGSFVCVWLSLAAVVEAAKAMAARNAGAADSGGRPEEPRLAQMFESHVGVRTLFVIRGSPNDKRRPDPIAGSSLRGSLRKQAAAAM